MTEIVHLITIPGSLLKFVEATATVDINNLIAAAESYPDFLFNQSWVHILLIMLLVFLNGFFVASEVALIKLRTSQLDKPEKKFVEHAVVTRKIFDQLDRFITACKFGASICGVLLGAVSVRFLVGVFNSIFEKREHPWPALDLAIAFVLSVCIVIALLVVFGKVVPNSIGFRREVEVSLRCSKPLYIFYLIFALPIIGLSKFSDWFLESVLKIEPASEREMEHTAEELRIIVEETGEDAVTDTERDILINALELNDLKVLDIVTPRSEVIALDVNESFEGNLERAVTSNHTRFPLIDEHLDETVGWVHIKDLISLMTDKKPKLERVCRTILRVQEDMKLDLLLRTLLNERANIALVNDEFGGAQGIVVRDQILKLLVEGTTDELEEGEGEEESKFEKISENEYVVAASMALHELDDLIPDLDLESLDVRTVGGYVTLVLGHLPAVGETAVIEGFMMKVIAADERKILSLKFDRILEGTNVAAG